MKIILYRPHYSKDSNKIVAFLPRIGFSFSCSQLEDEANVQCQSNRDSNLLRRRLIVALKLYICVHFNHFNQFSTEKHTFTLWVIRQVCSL